MALLNISSLIRSRRALVVVALVVPVIGAAIAVPAMMTNEAEPAPGSTAPLVAPAPAAVEIAEAEAADASAGAEEPTSGPRQGGDLDVAVALRFERYPAGAAVRATVSVVNNSLESVYLPAPSEPQSTLVILVLDDAGQTVRRVVEETSDATPRRMRLLGSGESTKFRIDVVTRDEESLAPGTYHLVASYDTDEAWHRSGLPVWTSPQGIRRSDPVTFEVIASE